MGALVCARRLRQADPRILGAKAQLVVPILLQRVRADLPRHLVLRLGVLLGALLLGVRREENGGCSEGAGGEILRREEGGRDELYHPASHFLRKT